MLPADSLKHNPPFIAALPFLSPVLAFLEVPQAPFNYLPSSSQRSLGDSFSVQIFAFHEYAVTEHPA